MRECYNTLLKCRAIGKYENKSAEYILKKEFDISSGLMKELKLSGRIFIDGSPCRSVDIAKSESLVSADIEEIAISEIPECEKIPNILFEDSHIVVIDKPSGLSVHPCLGNYRETLAGELIHHWRKNKEEHNFHAVSRPDKDTSGLCLIAKNRYSHHILSKYQQNGIIKKKYIAVVHGTLEESGEIELPIKREKSGIIKREISPDGKFAYTKYKTLLRGENFSLAEIELLTGRTHQIRLHMAAIGHPLFGDWLYGTGDDEKNLISRHALNVSKLTVKHPITGEEDTFFSGIPEDIKELMKKLNNI